MLHGYRYTKKYMHRLNAVDIDSRVFVYENHIQKSLIGEENRPYMDIIKREPPVIKKHIRRIYL